MNLTTVIKLFLAAHLFSLCNGHVIVVDLGPNNLTQGQVLHTFQNQPIYQILYGNSCPHDTIGIGGPDNSNVVLQKTVTYENISSLEPFCVNASTGTIAIQSYSCFIVIDSAVGILLIINIQPPILLAERITFPAAFYKGFVVEGRADAFVILHAEILPQTLPIPNILIPNYRIVGNFAHLFRVYKQQTGCLSHPVLETISSLDRELRNYYEVTLEAYAQHSPTMIFATTIIGINILDQNNKPPQIDKSSGLSQVVLSENVLPGTNLTQFQAVDEDIEVNGAVIFTSLSINMYLAVHPLSGAIFLYRSLYLQPITNISFELVAQDLGKPTHSDNYSITVLINRVNRIPPRITIRGLEKENTVLISERAVLGDQIITVDLEDQDSTGLTLSLDNIGPCNCFNLSNPQQTLSGFQFNISVAADLDYESALDGQYQFRLIASDNDIPTLTSSIQVSILIKDENEPPSFLRDIYHMSVVEGVPIGSSIGRVLAVDPDTGINGTLTYTILSQSPMNLTEIHHQSGIINTIADLDYEQIQSMKVVVQAEDEGGLLTMATIAVKVMDRNDNPPVFSPSSVNATVSVVESHDPDQAIFHFVAIDADSGCNGAVEYSILHTDRNVFHMDPVSGLLYPNNADSLDFEQFEFATVNVQVTDLGSLVRFSAETTLRIQLMGVNDEIPVIDPVDCPCFIMENVSPSSPGSSCPPLSAHDPDSETLMYSISNAHSELPFQIDTITGVISISSSLNREEQEVFKVAITVTDGSYISQPTILTVIVMDANDEGPTYNYGNYLTLTIPSNLSPGDLVADISARDADVGYNSISNYMFASGTLSHVDETFRVDSLSGMLYTKSQLDRSSYTFYLLVSDQLATDYRTMLNVTINVNGLKNNPPKFQPSVNHQTIPEDLSNNSLIATFLANDTDRGRNGQLTYSIVEKSSNHTGIFFLQSDGNLELVQSLSGKAGRIYTLNVSASDSGSPSLVDYQVLVVSVYSREFTLGSQSLVYNPGIPVCHYSGFITEGSDTVESLVSLPTMQDFRDVYYTILEGEGSATAFSVNQTSSTLQTQGGFSNVFSNTDAVFVTLVAQYGSNFHLCSVTVNIDDINNNPPIFNPSTYSFEIYSTTQVGSSVYRIRAVDADIGINARIVYNITNSNQLPFEIDNRTGMIHVAQSLSADDYSISVTAVDPDLPSATATATVTVHVLDVTNKPPVFTPVTQPVTTSETTVGGTFLQQLMISDQDGTYNSQGMNTFCIASGNLHNLFYVTPEGLLRENQLDYESFPVDFNITVMAYDNSLNPTFGMTVVRVQVMDENEPPMFSVPVYNAILRENEGIGTPVITVEAVDKDAGISGSVTYSVPVGIPFNVHKENGLIVSNAIINRENEDLIVFNVTATDSGNPPTSSTAEVHVTIRDINDNNPVFTFGNSIKDVREDVGIDFEITQISATDRDSGANAILQYAVVSGNEDRKFFLDPWTGSLRTAQALDYETLPISYLLMIQASDLGNPPLTTTTLFSLTIDVKDSNDNFPVFSSVEYICEIAEYAFQFSTVCQVNAMDVDRTLITYSIVDASNQFRINSSNGVVTPHRAIPPLDRMNNPAYVLHVLATDSGTEQTKTSSAILIVKIIENNDIPFRQSQEDSSYYIHESVPVNNLLFFAHYHDIDMNSNFSVITYGLQKQNSFFFVDSETGAVFVTGILDFETVSSPQTLSIIGSNPNGGSSKSTYLVNILDVNENQLPPVFDPEFNPAIVSLQRTLPIGYHVITLNATDPDEGNAITYAITGGTGIGYFLVNASTGEITTSFSLSSVASTKLTLQIRAIDGSNSFLLQSWHELTLSLSREILSKPIFELSVFRVTPSENAAQVIYVISAKTDGKADSSIHYAITAGNDDNTFSIDSQMGAISLATTANFDREIKPLYNVTVTASKPGIPGISRVLLVVDLQDVDDFRPQFRINNFNFTVFENFPVGINEPLVRIFAVDEDTGENGRLSYSLQNFPAYLFSISNMTGHLYLTRHLNRSESVSHDITVSVIDHGTRVSQSTDITFTITVEPPLFSPIPILRPIPSIILYEGSPQGTLVTRVTLENDLNLVPIIYRITNQTALVSVLPNTGEVYVAGPLDYETERIMEYTVEVIVGPGQIARTALVINLKDENDNRPSFNSKSYTFEINESNSTSGLSVGSVQATDQDSAGITNLTFSLEDSSMEGLFTIEASTGVIRLSNQASNVNREESPLYTLTVSVSDNGNPPLLDFVAVSVIVTDSDDFVPSFHPSSLNVFVPEDAALEYVVHTISAFDPDLGSNAIVSYELLTTGIPFLLNTTTGDVSISYPLDAESQSVYYLQIEGFNPNNPFQRIGSNLNLTITVLDVLDSGPVLMGLSTATIRENYPTYSRVTQIQSSDIARPVYYSIVDGNQLDHFLIEPLTGTVRTTTPLDREDVESYQLIIQGAFAMGFESFFELSVVVTDINDEAPSFSSAFISFQVPENSLSHQSLGNLIVIDTDQNQNIMFVIMDSFAASIFTVDSSGILRLNQNQELDRENKFSRLIFEVYAIDGGIASQLSKVIVVVEVTDSNDAPQFEKTDYSLTLSTPLLVGVPQFRVQAVDTDTGNNGDLTYSLSETNTFDTFNIDPASGNISIINNFMLQSQYSLILTVTDGGGLTASANLSIIVRACGFKNLTFNPSSATMSVDLLENATSGFVVVNSEEFHVLDLNTQANNMRADVEFSFLLSATSFVINSQTGEVRVVSLDREAQQVHRLVIQATDRADPSRIAQAELTVTVLDINDNSPQFLSTSYYATITEEDLMTSSPIYNVLRVSAIDSDEGSNSEIMYSLTQPSNLFSVERNTGFVRLVISLELLQIGTRFQFVVQATDAGNPPLSGTTIVTVNIVDSRAPQFTKSVYFVQLYENISPNTPILNVTVDGSLETGTISVRFFGNPTDIPFSLSNDGIITLVDPRLDYETQTSYNLTMLAYDINSGLNGFATFMVKVLDFNDEIPTFNSNGLYVTTVPENALIGTSILQVNAVDGDSLPNAQITYDLNANGSNLFIVDQMGIISLNGELDFEKVSIYEFDILAEDSGSPTLTGTAVVRLQIENINDNPPLFRQTVYTTSVQENDNAGPTDLFVSATDPDNLGVLIYGVVQGPGSDDFMISENGRLNLVVSNLTLAEYRLNISAFDGVFYGYAMLHVSVEGVNTNPPRFNATTYTASVSESSIVGVFIAQVFATDIDRGSNGRITYSLQDHNKYFSIDRETGEVTTNAGAMDIDREINPFLSVLVMATDGGSLSSLAQLRLTVNDINDNMPVFDQSMYNVLTLHNTDNDEVLIIRASDRDIGDNGRLTFSIANQSISNNLPFRVRSDTGVVYTITPPQMDVQSQYEFNVIVRDNGSPPLYSASAALVIINIAADNSVAALSFEQSQYSAMIAQDISFGGIVIMGIKVAAGNLTFKCGSYVLIGDNDPFILVDRFIDDIFDSSEIRVRATSNINSRNYTLFICATCLVSMSIVTKTTSTIKIEVLPVNSPPRLDLLYRANVFENSTVFPSVVMVSPQLQARDSDSSTTLEGTLEYRLLDHTDLFSINRDTGLLLLEQPLDFEIQEFYNLGVDAYDLGSPPLTASSTIRITVVDVDDNPPAFSQLTYSVEVFENATVGTLIHTSEAIDRDKISSHIYTISGDVFTIGTMSGKVRLLRQLDREQSSNYTATIAVRDTNGRAMATLIVIALDSNDQPPVFNQSEYRVNIRENYPVGVYFLRVFATDRDEGDNSIVIYKPGNDFTNSTVYINNRTGEIFFKLSPDHEESAQFTLHILATDIFAEMQTFISVIVILEDVNDNTPIFTQSHYTAQISENRPVGSIVDINTVDRVEAMDADSGVRSSLSYSIADQAADYFSIRDGNIISRVVFDRETNSSFNFLVVVTDMGSPPLSANVSVQVQISDQNDNSPEFPRPAYIINVSESIEIDSSIFSVAAMDADVGLNGKVGLYSLTGMHSSDFYRTMYINGSVSIFVGSILDHENEQRRQYRLTLTAFDDGFLNNFATREGSMLLTVNVIDVDDNSPKFTQQIYTATVAESISVGTTIISVLATDKDANDQSQLLYSIRNAGNNPEIGINSMTGIIFVANSLDYEGKTSYMLEVTVSGGIESAQVRIMVTDINDIPPHFVRDSTTINITENNQAGIILTSLQAEDVDSNDDRISYRIASGNVGDRFEIGSLGNVIVQEMLDRETQAFYNLTITAEDNDFPSLTGTTTLLVHVNDVNDNAPVAGHQDIFLFLFNGRAPEILLGDVFVNDSDIINDHAYKLVPSRETDDVLIRNDGSIRINTATPQVGTYFHTVTVSDQGSSHVNTTISTLVRNVIHSSIANSFTMQFVRITPQTFTDYHFRAFLDSSLDILQRELSTELDVQILSIQPSMSSSLSIDVTLAVMNMTSRMYIAPILVQYILHIHRRELQTASLELTIFTESVDLCSTEKCSISTSCVNLYQYSLSDIALGSRSITYLGIASYHNFSCTAPPASLCDKVTCPSPARCVLKRDGGYFKAECLTDCSSQPCRNGGTCVDQEPGYFCQCQSGYVGRDCKLTVASFFGNSYAIFPSLQGHPSGTISFEFTTKIGSNSLLLYNGRFDTETSDYMYMVLLDGHACLGISYGKDTLQRCVKSWEFLGDGLWHLITIEYSVTQVRIAVVSYDLYTEDENVITGFLKTSLDLNGPLFLGKVPPGSMNLPPSISNLPGFNGCFRNVLVKGEMLDFTAPLLQSNLEAGTCSLERCSPNPCKNNGKCFGRGSCDCPPEFTGANCTLASDLITFLGKDFIQYQIINTGVQALKRQAQNMYVTAQNLISLSFITKEPSGTLLQIGDPHNSSEYMIVEVSNGYVQLRYNLGGGAVTLVLSSAMVADAKPQVVLITRTEGSVEILLNNSFVNRTTATASNTTITLSVSSDHLFLGAEVNVKTGEVTQGFTGCLMGVRLDRKEIPFGDLSSEDFAVVKFPPSGVLSGCPLLNVVESNQPKLYVYSGITITVAVTLIISVAFIISCTSLNAWRRSRQDAHAIARHTDSFAGSPRQSEFFWQPTLRNSKQTFPSDDQLEFELKTSNGASRPSLLESPVQACVEINLLSTSNPILFKPEFQVDSVSSFLTVPVSSETMNQSNPGYLTSTPTSSDQEDGEERGRKSRDTKPTLLHQSVQSIHSASSKAPKTLCVPIAPPKIPDTSKRVQLSDPVYEERDVDEMKHFNEEGPYEPLGSIGSLHDIVLDLDKDGTSSAKPTPPAELSTLKIGQQSSPSIAPTNSSPVKPNPPSGQEDRPGKDHTNIGLSSLGLLPSGQQTRHPITQIIDETPKKSNQLIEVQPPKPPRFHHRKHVEAPLPSQQTRLPIENVSLNKNQEQNVLMSSNKVCLDEEFSQGGKEKNSSSRDEAQRLNRLAKKPGHKT